MEWRNHHFRVYTELECLEYDDIPFHISFYKARRQLHFRSCTFSSMHHSTYQHRPNIQNVL